MNPSLKPVPKVQAAGVGGAATLLLIYGASLVGIELPEAVAGALIVVGSFLAGYFKKA